MLLIDGGNSRLKAQWWRDCGLQESLSISYNNAGMCIFQNWLAGISATRCYLAMVVGPAKPTGLEQCLREKFDSAITRFTSETQCLGVTTGYKQPERLGVDRWLSLIAVPEITHHDCIIIDAGSAITVDLLRADGQHLGGAIIAGTHTSQDAFRAIFAHIDFSRIDLAANRDPGYSTESAIQIEYRVDSLDLLQTLIGRWKNKVDVDAKILLGGGDANDVESCLELPVRRVSDLVFKGMRRIIKSQS